MSQNDAFLKAFRGSFVSLLRWPQFDEFWEKMRTMADDDWYIYAIGEAPPATTTSKMDLLNFLEESDRLLHKEHDEDYCGIVYVDDKNDPTFIKIFDPNNLGVSCGYSDNPPLPGWIISRIKPSNLDSLAKPTQSRKRWWNKIFSQ